MSDITVKTLYKKELESVLEPPNYVTLNATMLEEWKRITDIFKGTPFLDSGDKPLLERTVTLYSQYWEFQHKLMEVSFEDDPKLYKSYSDTVDKIWSNYQNCCEKLGLTSLTRVNYLSKLVDLYNKEASAKEETRFNIPVPGLGNVKPTPYLPHDGKCVTDPIIKAFDQSQEE